MLFVVPTCPSVPVFSFLVSVIIFILTFFGGWKLKNLSKQLRNGNASMPDTINFNFLSFSRRCVNVCMIVCVCV